MYADWLQCVRLTVCRFERQTVAAEYRCCYCFCAYAHFGTGSCSTGFAAGFDQGLGTILVALGAYTQLRVARARMRSGRCATKPILVSVVVVQ